eukprot:TRINITY_DN6485_c0_g1_i1.p1 TRINITY_DN6485_c0_g1~~TRINITY_DN6485_c0_g1_i1.p1  ORF type:complete len:1411 (-),score=544.52 TRINITY_DN6485_c0_g1_i1:64-4296(-)
MWRCVGECPPGGRQMLARAELRPGGCEVAQRLLPGCSPERCVHTQPTVPPAGASSGEQVKMIRAVAKVAAQSKLVAAQDALQAAEHTGEPAAQLARRKLELDRAAERVRHSEGCGDGRRRPSIEDCDDGNLASGDGCDASCAVEHGFVCINTAGAPSQCSSSGSFEASLLLQASEGHRACSTTNHTGFLMLSPHGHGACRPLPPNKQGLRTSGYHQPGGLAKHATVSSRAMLTSGAPFPVPAIGAAPYAICLSERHSVCGAVARSSPSRSAHRCFMAGRTRCVAVVTDVAVCSSSDGGVVVQLNSSQHQGPACAFRGCKVPDSWIDRQGRSASSADWCLGVAERGGDYPGSAAPPVGAQVLLDESAAQQPTLKQRILAQVKRVRAARARAAGAREAKQKRRAQLTAQLRAVQIARQKKEQAKREREAKREAQAKALLQVQARAEQAAKAVADAAAKAELERQAAQARAEQAASARREAVKAEAEAAAAALQALADQSAKDKADAAAAAQVLAAEMRAKAEAEAEAAREQEEAAAKAAEEELGSKAQARLAAENQAKAQAKAQREAVDELAARWEAKRLSNSNLNQEEAAYWESSAEQASKHINSSEAVEDEWTLAQDLTHTSLLAVQHAKQQSRALQRNISEHEAATQTDQLRARELTMKQTARLNLRLMQQHLHASQLQRDLLGSDLIVASKHLAEAAAADARRQLVEAKSAASHSEWMQEHQRLAEQLGAVEERTQGKLHDLNASIAQAAHSHSTPHERASLTALQLARKDASAAQALLREARAADQHSDEQLRGLYRAHDSWKSQLAAAQAKAKAGLQAQRSAWVQARAASAAAERRKEERAAQQRSAALNASLHQEGDSEALELAALLAQQSTSDQSIQAQGRAVQHARQHAEAALTALQQQARVVSAQEQHAHAVFERRMRVQAQQLREMLHQQRQHASQQHAAEKVGLQHTRAAVDSTLLQLQQQEGACTASLGQMPAPRAALLRRIAAAHTARAASSRSQGPALRADELQLHSAVLAQQESAGVLFVLQEEAAAAHAKLMQAGAVLSSVAAQVQHAAQHNHDCVLSGWSNWSACSAACDRGEQHRERAVLRVGRTGVDGCAQHALSQRRECAAQPCQLCGDGRKVGTEACDDGNLLDGDGCSASCAVEPSFSCTAGSPNSASQCTPCGDGLLRGAEQCDSSPGCDPVSCTLLPAHVLLSGTDASPTYTAWQHTAAVQLQDGLQRCQRAAQYYTAHGTCAATPAAITGPASSALSTSLQLPPAGSAAATAASQAGAVLSADYAAQLSSPGGPAAVFAVCSAARAQRCAVVQHTTGWRRECITRGLYRCSEVNTDTAYCHTAQAKAAGGYVALRGHSSRTDEQGQVCVFDGCAVPVEWRAAGGSIESDAWCYDVTAQAGVTHYLV